MKNIPLYGIVNLPEMEAAAIEVLRSGRIAGGDYVSRFEAGIGALVGQPHVVSTVDMSSAMFLALHLAGVGAGDEVLTTAFACMASNAAIAQCGARPVWVDTLPGSVEIDLTDLAAKIGPRCKAAILYHVAGYPGPAAQMAALCRQHGIALVEDCDNALFACRDGLHVGSHADFSVYSFYPNRQINASEGGALVCKSAEAAARARRLRRFGIDGTTFRDRNGDINPASDIAEVGWAFTMNNLCAALGCAQLSSAAARVQRSRDHAATLTGGLNGLPQLRPVAAGAGAQPAYWVLLLLVEQRDAVLARIRAHGVQASSIHQRNDGYSGFHCSAPAVLPNTTYLQEHVLALPCGWWLDEEDLVRIVDAVRDAVGVAAPS